MTPARNLKIFPLFEILYSFRPHFLIAPLFYQQILGSYTLAMSIFSATLISCSLTEVPMGIVSDFIGRKKTLILGATLYLVGLLVFTFSGINPQYSLLSCFAAAIIIGISQALFSGTIDAIIYESAQILNQTDEYKKYYSRGKGWGSFSSALSALFSGIISYYTSYLFCFALSAFAAAFLLILNFFWVNINQTQEYKTSFGIIKHISAVFNLFKTNQRLMLLSLAKVLGDNVSYRLDIIYFKTLIPEYLFGVPRMAKKVFECISYLFASALIEKLKPLKTLVISNIWMMGVRTVAISINNFASPFITSMVDLFDGTSATASSILLQKEYRNNQRATLDSVVSMVSTAWTAVLLLLIGVIVDHTSARFAIGIMLGYRFLRLYIYYLIARIKQL